MVEPRRIVTAAQGLALLGYLEESGDLVLGRDRTAGGRTQYRKAWERCAAVVNRTGEPRSGRAWAKYWCELKCRVRAKLAAGAKVEYLTPFEERVSVFVKKTTEYPENVERKEEESEMKEEEAEKADHSPRRSSLTPEQPPRMPSPVPPAFRRGRVTSTRGTQYSSTSMLHTMITNADERRARFEERSARIEERRSRIEARRARTEQLLAEAVMQRTEAAVVQAEAARTQAQALTNISQAFQHFVDLASHFMSQPNRY